MRCLSFSLRRGRASTAYQRTMSRSNPLNQAIPPVMHACTRTSDPSRYALKTCPPFIGQNPLTVSDDGLSLSTTTSHPGPLVRWASSTVIRFRTRHGRQRTAWRPPTTHGQPNLPQCVMSGLSAVQLLRSWGSAATYHATKPDYHPVRPIDCFRETG